MRRLGILMLLLAGLLVLPSPALADSISPTDFSTALAVGESVTITKTVTVSAGTPTAAQGDVFFLCDTTGSMGGTIDSVKTNASSILTGLSTYGNISTGAGYYKDFYTGYESKGWGSPGDVPYALNSAIGSAASTQAGIGAWSASGGADGYESQLYALKQVATQSATGWRTGSQKFVLWFGDYAGHEPSNTPDYPGPSTADTINALQAAGIKVFAFDMYGLDSLGQATAITGATGGTLTNGLGSNVVDTIIAAIGEGFTNYSVVSIEVPDLAGLDITVVPTSYAGAFDRSIDRSFTFDVTFTALAEGTYDFFLHGLVDGGRIADEHDVIRVGSGASVPEPGTLLLMGSGLLGLGLIRRFMK